MRALNDKLMLQDVLAHLRDLMTQSGMAIQHSNCQIMRDTITKTCGRTAEHQFKIFQYMHDNGYYPVQNVDDKQIKTAVDTHCGK